MLAERRIKGIPVTFLAVLIITVLLTIFFGAWAVSTDVNPQVGGLSFAVAGSDPDNGGSNVEPPSEAGVSASSDEGSGSTADTWWGNALRRMKACPLH